MALETDQDSETGAAADRAAVPERPLQASPLESGDATASCNPGNDSAPLNKPYRMGKVEDVLWNSPDGRLVVPLAELIAEGGIRDDCPVPISWVDSRNNNQS